MDNNCSVGSVFNNRDDALICVDQLERSEHKPFNVRSGGFYQPDMGYIDSYVVVADDKCFLGAIFGDRLYSKPDAVECVQRLNRLENTNKYKAMTIEKRWFLKNVYRIIRLE